MFICTVFEEFATQGCNLWQLVPSTLHLLSSPMRVCSVLVSSPGTHHFTAGVRFCGGGITRTVKSSSGPYRLGGHATLSQQRSPCHCPRAPGSLSRQPFLGCGDPSQRRFSIGSAQGMLHLLFPTTVPHELVLSSRTYPLPPRAWALPG